MTPLELMELVFDHAEARAIYQRIKRERRRASRAEHLCAERCRRLRAELEYFGVTITQENKPKE